MTKVFPMTAYLRSSRLGRSECRPQAGTTDRNSRWRNTRMGREILRNDAPCGASRVGSGSKSFTDAQDDVHETSDP